LPIFRESRLSRNRVQGQREMRLPLLAGSLFCLIVLGAVLPTSAADAGTWSLDGVRLGAKIDQVIASRGKPSRTVGNLYYWDNAAGGVLHVETDRHGNIAEIDVHGGPHEIRTVSLPALPPQVAIVLGESGHVNYIPPADATPLDEDLCAELGLAPGKPCETLTLKGGAILIINFGIDTGMADGLLSDIILAAPGYFGGSTPEPSASPTRKVNEFYCI
jgi:hypothetical protein